MDVIGIDIEGMDEFIRMLEEAEDLFMKNLKLGMREYSLLVETGGRALAQRYGGDLEESIIAAAVAVENGMVIGEVGSNLIYAWRRHEEPYRSGRHPLYDNGIKIEDYYVNGLGRRSYQKRSWKGQLPGRKFLERAVVATEPDFLEMCERVLDVTLRGRSY